MELVYMIIFYLACFGVAFNIIFLLPRYTIKRYKAQSYRDSHHYEVCILLTLAITASFVIVVIGTDSLVQWPY